jgi:hypothetical protein
MPAFLANLKAPGLKYIEEKDKDTGDVTGAYPVAQVRLTSADGDPHELCERLAEMVGKRVRVSIILEQTELPFAGAQEGDR